MELTDVEKLLVYMLKENGVSMNDMVGILTILKTAPQQIELIKWIAHMRYPTTDQILQKTMEIIAPEN